MQKIQYVSKYISLSEEGLVDRILCPIDQGPLYVNQDLEDTIYFYCLSCNHKKTIGSIMYSQIVKAVKEAINE